MKEMNIEEIYRLLQKHYDKNLYDPRPMIITPSYCTYGKIGYYLFALNGSPPKGFAIYKPEGNMLYCYDTLGKRFKKIHHHHSFFKLDEELAEIKKETIIDEHDYTK